MGKHRTARKFTGAKKQDKTSGLGRMLINARKADEAAHQVASVNRHNEDVLGDGNKLISKVDQQDYAVIVAQAQIELESHAKKDLTIVDKDADVPVAANQEQKQFMKDNLQLLRIPRRPAWKKEMNKGELERQEVEAFYQWRGKIAQLEDTRTVSVAPFEKNIEYWRQLWRVIEFSDVVLQIIDARNPLCFYNRDFVQYAKEVGIKQRRQKRILVILNKADLVPLKARRIWSEFLTEQKIEHVYFSALREEAFLKHLFNLQKMQKATDEEQIRSGQKTVDDIIEETSESEEVTEPTQQTLTTATNMTGASVDTAYMRSLQHKQIKRDRRNAKRLQVKQDAKEEVEQVLRIPEVCMQVDDAEEQLQFDMEGFLVKLQKQEEIDMPAFIGSPKILTRQQLSSLIQLLTLLQKSKQTNPAQKSTVGTVGFPNIGKSSIINILALETGLRTAVGETPGKTKHFQTIQLTPQVELCDCPGLVFPTFSYCRADFVLNGIIPVDKERDWHSYTKLLCKRIPRSVFEKVYGIQIENDDKFESGIGLKFGTAPNARYCNYIQLMDAMELKFGGERGALTRRLVKDLFRGKLLWVALPPQLKKSIAKPLEEEGDVLVSRQIGQKVNLGVKDYEEFNPDTIEAGDGMNWGNDDECYEEEEGGFESEGDEQVAQQ